MTHLIWPLTSLIALVFVSWYFKIPLTGLIERISKITLGWFHTSHDASDHPKTSSDDGESTVVARLNEGHLAEIARIEQRHAERYEKDIEPLKQAVTKQMEQIEILTSRLEAVEAVEPVKVFLQKGKSHIKIY